MARRARSLVAALSMLVLIAGVACRDENSSATTGAGASITVVPPGDATSSTSTVVDSTTTSRAPDQNGGFPTTTQELSPSTDALREQLTGALLDTPDLSGNWSLLSTEEHPHQGSLFCDTPFEAGTAPLFRLTRVFQESDTRGVLSQRISVYPPGGAELVMSEFRAATEDCDEWTKITESGSQTWRLLPLDLDRFGDESIALDLPSTVGALTIDNHFVMIRVGDVVTILGYGGPFVEAIDPAVTAAFARRAADKLDGAR